MKRTDVACGMRTIADHEERLDAIEQKLGIGVEKPEELKPEELKKIGRPKKEG